MTNHEYWQRRMERKAKNAFKDYDKYAQRLQDTFDRAAASLDEKFHYYIGRLAKNNRVDEQGALEILNKQKLMAFNMDLEEYIAWASKNPSAFTKKIVEDASNLAHISHVQAMRKQMDMISSKLWVESGKDMQSWLGDKYLSTYYSTAKDLQDFSGKYKHVNQISERNLKDILEEPWAPDGRDFSSRVWNNRAKLSGRLQSELADVVTGTQGTLAAAENIMTDMKSSLGEAKRLVHGEMHHLLNRGQYDAFKEQGVEKFEFSATLDNRTSPFCQDRDGKVYSIEDYQEGVTAPPHPGGWCRSTIIPRYDDDDLDSGERAARDPDTDKTVLVDADMDYKTWYNKYVEKGATRGIDKPKTLNYIGSQSSVNTIEKAKAISNSPVLSAEKVEDVVDYFSKTYKIDVSGFENVDVDKMKVTLSAVDDFAKRFPEAGSFMYKIEYNPKYRHYAEMSLAGRMTIGKHGLAGYETGIHECAHALDFAKSKKSRNEFSENILKQARKKLKMRVNSKEYGNLIIKTTGKIEIKNEIEEAFACCLETELTDPTRGNELTKAVLEVIEEVIP